MSVSNQYWMPDHLCKVCYDCSAAFSLWRRRHHCRLCGQIFCYECSNCFIDGTCHGFPGAIRVCKFCVRLNDGASDETTKKESGRLADGPDELERSRKFILSHFDSSPCQLSGDYGCAKPSPFVFGPPVELNEVRLSLMSPVNSNSSDSKARLEQPTDSTRLTAEHSYLFEEFGAIDSHERSYIRTKSRTRRSSAELLIAIESGGLDAKVPNHKWPYKLVSKQDGSTLPKEIQRELGALNTTNLSPHRDLLLDANMQKAYDQICDGIVHSTSSIWNNLSEHDSIDMDHLVETLKDMAFVVTGHLLYSMNFRSIRGFNYANLVKVKSIAKTARVPTEINRGYGFKWLAGTVCHKHLSHKQMAREVTNPRILLFACGITYGRPNSAGRMSSLDTLLEQEKRYMAILVEKISVLEPDVIFVEKAVSRHAQELLYERRISIVLNVKEEILHRIARHTGAEVLTSVDHVDKADPEKVIGSCRLFTVKSIPVVLDERRAKKPLETLVGAFAKTPAAPGRMRTDTYLYLEGCDPLNGCTVLITGPSKQTLRLLKRLTRDVLSMTYHLLLEAHVLSDLDLGKNTLVSSKGSAGLVDEQCATWCTTSTLRVRDPGSPNPRYRQCAEAKHLRIAARSNDDISFGNFLYQELAALSLKCQNVKCNHLMADHVHAFSCRTGTITISFEKLPDKSKPPFSLSKMSHVSFSEATDKTFDSFSELSRTMDSINLPLLMTPRSTIHTPRSDGEPETKVGIGYPTLAFSRWCRECNAVVTPFVPLAKYVYKYSFARLLEVLFSGAERFVLPKPSSTCTHTSKESRVLFFNIGESVARFDFSRQVSLRLDRTEFKHSNDALQTKASFAETERVFAKKEVTTRIETLKELLGLLISTFGEKIRKINQAVEAFENTISGHHTRIILEAVCISKIVRSGDAVFTHKLALIDGDLAEVLSACDTFQRALYLVACKWIACMLRLRESIMKHLATEVAPVASHSRSFTLGGIALLPPTYRSTTKLPNVVEESFLPSCTTDTESDGGKGTDPLAGGRRTDALGHTHASQPVTDDAVMLSSSPTLEEFDSSERATIPFPDASSAEEDGKEGGSKKALWDLCHILGQSEPASECSIDFPDALTAGHPSLPHQSKSRVVLVDEAKPITNVAYALSTASYEEELDGWNIRMHSEAVGPVAVQNQQEVHVANATSMNVSRAALETSLNMPFKFETEDMPLHLSLSSRETASTSSSTCWEFSTIVHYPLQFEVLRELFYGSDPSYVFSIAHVESWNTNGGKSGASFYRTLDGRFVVKHISLIEMQSFLSCLPAYFTYVASIYYDCRASLLSKTVGLYQTTVSRRDTGEKMVYYICVMENVFYQKQLTQTFDLKGSARNRMAKPRHTPEAFHNGNRVLLDGNFLEVTRGRSMAVLAEDHRYILEAVQNDTAFLNSIKIVDYSMVVGLTHRYNDTGEKETLSGMTIGIIDYFRQFDLIKRVESVGKSVGMIAGQSSPTIIEPCLYGHRFQAAVRRYFMPISPISSGTNDDIKDCC